MSSQIEQAKELRRSGNHSQAVAVLEGVLMEEPGNAAAWWVAGLAHHSLKNREKAIDHLRQVVKLAPNWVPGWAQLGVVLSETGNFAEGEKFLFHALRLQPEHEFSLRQLAKFARQQKDYARELNYLLELYSNGSADADDLNQIGIAAYNQKDFTRAIEFYHLSIAAKPSKVPLYNLALIYSDPAVSQDVDAADCLSRALDLDPEYKAAKDRLGVIADKLNKLAAQALAAGPLLDKQEWYRFYLNPFEILQADRETSLESLDNKWIQSQKRRIKHELQLEDGRLEVLGNVQMDGNKILECIDELYDDDRKACHWNVFQTPLLLRFLTRGEIDHFLYYPGYFPRGILEALDWVDFKEWLSQPFSLQYDLVLGRAIERESMIHVEVLLDGRRWIVEKHDAVCFEGSRRQVARRLEPLQSLVDKAVNEIPSLIEIEAALGDQGSGSKAPGPLVELLNLLSDNFRDQQSKAVELVRSLALTAYNEHGDADLSKAILDLSSRFTFKSPRLRHQLEDDFKAIDNLIRKERAHEAKYSLGQKPMEVTKEGVKVGERFLRSSEIEGIRWGINVTHDGYSKSFDYLLAFRDLHSNTLIFNWKTNKNIEKQTESFNALLKASLRYIVPTMIERIQEQLDSGKSIKAGGCLLTKWGVVLDVQGWFSLKQKVIPWDRVGTEIVNGEFHVFDKSNRAVTSKSPLREAENAVVVQVMANS